jgi:Mn2+/Fe2+ NRAMP family transporter
MASEERAAGSVDSPPGQNASCRCAFNDIYIRAPTTRRERLTHLKWALILHIPLIAGVLAIIALAIEDEKSRNYTLVLVGSIFGIVLTIFVALLIRLAILVRREGSRDVEESCYDNGALDFRWVPG